MVQSASFSADSDPKTANIDAAKLGLEPKQGSVLFSDIYGYRRLTQDLDSSEAASLLNEYFQSLLDAIYKYKQNLNDKIELACIRNALIAVFGSPNPLEDHAWTAVQTAREMCDRLTEYNKRRSSAGQPAIKIGIGINSDLILSGQLGSDRPMDFAAIGDGVNLAYYLEGVSKQYDCEIVLSENTHNLCSDKIWARKLDLIRIRNNYPPVEIYEFICGRDEAISEQKQKVLEHYNKGREHYLNREFAIALGQFVTVLGIDSNDRPSTLHLKRCQQCLKEPPSDDWDGSVPIWKLEV